MPWQAGMHVPPHAQEGKFMPPSRGSLALCNPRAVGNARLVEAPGRPHKAADRTKIVLSVSLGGDGKLDPLCEEARKSVLNAY